MSPDPAPVRPDHPLGGNVTTSHHRIRRAAAGIAGALALLLAVAGCGEQDSVEQPGGDAPSASADDELAALVPDEIKADGKILVGVDATALSDDEVERTYAERIEPRWMVGIDAASEAPPGGVIRRDENGEPNGVLREGAGWMVRKAGPERPEAR